jgi:DinB superfamily
MTNENLLIEGGLQAWKFNETRIDKFFQTLSEEQLQQEIAPGRNRLIYLWGHISAVNDALFPLLGIGPKLFPELDTMFVSNPDRAVPELYSGAELKQAADQINHALWTAFTRWTTAEWLEKHTNVSAEDFAREPQRNRFTVVVNRNTHMAFHFGQAILTKPRT